MKVIYLLQMSEVRIGPTAKVFYLEDGHCNSKSFKEVCLISSSSRQFGFNKLLLASMSEMLRDVMAHHFSSPNYSHGERVYISTQFADQELEHLHQLCHFGRLLLTAADSKPCLKSFGVDLSDFDMSGQVFDVTAIKLEADDSYGDLMADDEEYPPLPNDFLDVRVKDSDDFVDYEGEFPAQQEFSTSNCAADILPIQSVSDLLNTPVKVLRSIAESHDIKDAVGKHKSTLVKLISKHFMKVHKVHLPRDSPVIKVEEGSDVVISIGTKKAKKCKEGKSKDTPPKSWSEEVKASVFHFPSHLEASRDLSLTWQCGKCTRGFRSVEAYRQHSWRHTIDGDHSRSFICLRCMEFQTSTKRALLEHKKQDCNSSKRNVDLEQVFTYYCAICEKEPFDGLTFPTSAGYQSHLSTEHQNEMVSTSTNGDGAETKQESSDLFIECNSCGKQFASGLKQYLSHHKRKYGPFHEEGKCWACPSRLPTWKAMQEHIREHHNGEFKYLCGFCGINAFPTEARMAEHRCFCRVYPATEQVKQVEGDVTACTVCGEMVTNTMMAVKSHLAEYHSEAALKCKICQAPFFTAETLKAHMKVMHTKASFSCAVCGKCYSKKNSLKTHELIHGEPQFSCQTCGKMFYRVETLRTHERFKHDPKFKEAEDAKKKVCDICGWEGAKRNYLHHVKYNHMQDEQTCDMCSKKFKSKIHLQKHVNRDHNFKQCSECGVTVKHLYYKRHMKVVHKVVM